MAGKRARRSFTKEFKADAVKMVLAGRSATQVAADLDLTETALREWVRRAEADAGTGSPEVLTTEERNDLARLRKENKVLKMERETLKAAALHSTGQCNLFTKSFGRRPVGEDLARSHVHLPRNPIELSLRYV